MSARRLLGLVLVLAAVAFAIVMVLRHLPGEGPPRRMLELPPSAEPAGGGMDAVAEAAPVGSKSGTTSGAPDAAQGDTAPVPEPAVSADTGGAAVPDGASPVAAATPRASASPAVEGAAPPGPVGKVRVTVQAPDGSPVTGAVVRATLDGMAGLMKLGSAESGAHASTEETGPGSYEVSLLAEGTYRVHVEAEGWAPATRAGIKVRPEAEVAITLAPGVAVTGQVLDPGHAAVARALVMVLDADAPMAALLAESLAGPLVAAGEPAVEQAAGQDDETGREEGRREDRTGNLLAMLGLDLQRTWTGPDGRFEVPHVPAGRRLVLAAHPDYPAAREVVDVPAAGAGPDLELRFQQGGAIVLTIRRITGEPVAQGLAMAQGTTGGRRTATIGEDGCFRMKGLAAGNYMLVYMASPETGAVTETRPVRVKQGETSELEIVLGAGVLVRGRLVRAGEAVPGAMLQVWKATGVMGSFKMAKTDAEGRFELTDLEPGEYKLGVFPRGIESVMDQISLPLSVPAQAAIDVVLEIPTATVSGRVIDAATGEGIESAVVVVTRGGRSAASGMGELLERYSGQATTDKDGVFAAAGLSPGTYDVQVMAEGYVGALRRDVAAFERPEQAASNPLLIALDRGVRVQGLVLSQSGAPVERAYVVFVDPATGVVDLGSSSIRSAPDGRFALPAVTPGIYRLYVCAEGYAETRLAAATIAEGVELRIVVQDAGTLEVAVHGPDGTPVEGAGVTVFYPDGETAFRYMDVDAMFGGTANRTGKDGVVVRPGLAPGPYTVRVEHPGRQAAESTVQVTAGQTARVEVVLR